MNALQKVAVRFLLGLYILAIFKPCFPYVEYAFNKKFIAQQLCENRTKPELNCEGSCYLAKRLAQAEEHQSTPDNSVPAKYNFDKDTLHLCQIEETVSDHPNLSLLPHLANRISPAAQFVADIFHPPRIGLFLL